MKRIPALSVVALFGMAAAIIAVPAAPAQDNVEPPWGTPNGDIFGRARSDAIPAYFDANSVPSEDWRFDTLAIGLNRPGGWGALVFDGDGNLYWRTTLGNNKLVSVTSSGTLRWIAEDGGGAEYVFGNGWSSASPIIGANLVYAKGDGAFGGGGEPVMAAFNKADGTLAWETLLPAEVHWTNNNQPTPILYQGKLYLLGQTDGFSANVYQMDAATGTIDWSDPISLFFGIYGTMALVPGVFPNGDHGLYFNTTSGSGVDGFGEIYGVRIDPDAATGGAALEWESDGGHTNHSHVIYSDVTGNLYTHTWNDFGASLYVHDPLTGALVASNDADTPAGGHGFYDVGALDWDNVTVVAGGFDGRVGRYTDNLDGTLTSVAIPYNPLYGEYKVLGQLLQTGGPGPVQSVLVSGTNSRCGDFGFDAKVVSLNLDLALTGPFEDGPMYVDDVEVLQGSDINNLVNVFSDDLEGIPLGVLAGNGGWVHDNAAPSGDDAANPVLVVDDPTGGGQGHVMLMDADGTGGGWQGVFQNFTDTTATIVVVRWRQWRADLTDNSWPYFGDAVNDFGAAWTLGWDINSKYFAYHFDDNGAGDGSVLQEAAVWETVQFTYDFNNFTVQLTITPDAGAPKVGGLVDQFEFGIYGIGFQLEGTALSGNVNLADMEYSTGICADHGFTTRGGPLTGPDGKIYYFDAGSRELVALCPYECGDANCDGVFDGADIDPFFSALGTPALWAAQYPNCHRECAADINGDGAVDGADIDAFFAALGDGMCP